VSAPLPAGVAAEYCRDVLPRVSRTFAINIELLDPHLRDVVRVAYLLCRAADALEDSWPGPPADIVARFDAFRRALDGDAAEAGALARDAAARGDGRDDLALVAHLPLVLAALDARPAPEREVVRECVHTMAQGMSRYASRAAARAPSACYVDDEAELAEYCWIVAGCVGVMLTKLVERRLPARDGAHAARLALAPRVGEALQLTNILLDLPTDLRRGRCYLPAAWLDEHGLAPADFLGEPRPDGRAVAARLETLAHGALDRVADYLATIPRRAFRYRVFCLWPALWARASLRLVHGDPGFPFRAERRRLSRGALWSAALGSLPFTASHRAVRRILAH
jgi:farnesyl-diphosphate farnesyltransferase